MNERILNLLSLCMQAQKKGLNVIFDNCGTSTTVWHHSSVECGQEIIWYITIIYNNHPENEFFKAEAYLKGLIS